MGEIAEMMLDGTLCEGCGEYIGEPTGFPGYCSRRCAEDRGAIAPDNRPKLTWLRVRKEGSLGEIPGWVRKRHVNTYSGPRQDRKGDWIIMLGWDARPDSDFGRFKGNSAAIWFGSRELATAGETLVRKGLGWKEPPASQLA